jgi:transposase-like protein
MGMGKGRGHLGKVAVMGLLQRHGKDGHSTIRVATLTNRKRYTLQAGVRMNVEPGATVYTDALPSYTGLSSDYVHGFIDHAETYVDGQIHTNGCENFWSLLKRGIKGTYVAVEPFHLFRYLDEQAFRFNQRTLTDAERFSDVVTAVVGRRLTYAQLIAALDASAHA